ncbi:hypothetical protein M422DRAFT_246008 [Sphaerobolus stellatus SS14]|nr:hypothetical protein M422DRAFT_246008 [Sphaerobolus stellatus SS14]
MPYCHPITDEQLASFLDAAKSLLIPTNEVPPLVIEEVPAPSMFQNLTILAMNQALIAETIKTNANNVKEYEEPWYREKAEDTYVTAKEDEVKQRAEAAARKAEEAAKAAAEDTDEEDEHVMDANPEGEDEVDQDEIPKSKLKKRTKSRPIMDSEIKEETKEVKVKRRKAKGKGKAVDTEYKRNMVPVNYVGCPGVPICKMCEGCKVPENAKYQRPCVADAQMDANDQIFYVRVKDRCFVCLMRNNVCSFTRDDEVDFMMPEAANDEELQAKLKKLYDKQDVFKKQKDKERLERSKKPGNSTKAGTNAKARTNAKASESTPKASGVHQSRGSTEEGENIANSAGRSGRVLSVAESLHGNNKALIETVNILGDTRATSESQSKTLRGIETCMVNLQSAMQMYVGQVHYHLGELEKRARNWATKDEEVFSQPVENSVQDSNVVSSPMVEEPEDRDIEVEEVREEVEEIHEEDKEGREVEDDETMKHPEVDEL